MPLVSQKLFYILHFISERWIIFSQETLLPFGTHPQSSPQSGCDVCDEEKRFDPSRLKPLDPQKHRGEVMIGALIGARDWGLKAHRGHVSFGSKVLPTLPQIHLPPYTAHVHQSVSEWRREKKRASLQIWKQTTKNSLLSLTTAAEVCEWQGEGGTITH